MRPAFHVGGLVRKERTDHRDESSRFCFSILICLSLTSYGLCCFDEKGNLCLTRLGFAICGKLSRIDSLFFHSLFFHSPKFHSLFFHSPFFHLPGPCARGACISGRAGKSSRTRRCQGCRRGWPSFRFFGRENGNPGGQFFAGEGVFGLVIR